MPDELQSVIIELPQKYITKLRDSLSKDRVKPLNTNFDDLLSSVFASVHRRRKVTLEGLGLNRLERLLIKVIYNDYSISLEEMGKGVLHKYIPIMVTDDVIILSRCDVLSKQLIGK